jgi:hypothetical protein
MLFSRTPSARVKKEQPVKSVKQRLSRSINACVVPIEPDFTPQLKAIG